MTRPSQNEAAEFGFRDVTILVLSIYVLAALIVQETVALPPDVDRLLDHVDFAICIVFLADFAIRFHQAPSKLAYMKWGWIDLISSIPAWDPLRWGRAARIFKILRVMRSFRSVRYLLAFLYRNRGRGTLATAAISVCFLILGASIAILILEGHRQGTAFSSPFAAVWWSVSTITTVGYGDVVPQTPEGKVVAMILMVSGIALFGVFTGLFARLLMGPEPATDGAQMTEIATELRLMRERLDRLELERNRASGAIGAAVPPLGPGRGSEETERSVPL